MIWHFFEVWLLIVMTFCVGCVLGAFLYGILADSRLSVTQGAVADGVGDMVDWAKVRFGLGPAWRPKHYTAVARSVSPPLAPADDPEPVMRAEPPRLMPPEPERAPTPRAIAPPLRGTAPTPRVVLPRERARLPAPERRIEPAPPAERTAPRREPEAPPADEERAASAEQIGADGVVPMRPAGLGAPRGGVPDNLTRIKGIGQRNEELLNSLGIFHFGQIAAWTPGEVRWIGQYLAFPERIERDDWVGQAIALASGLDTGFEKSAERRRRRRQ